MRYVDAGYSIVLGILFAYGVNLAWRNRRISRSARRVAAHQGRTEEVGVR